MIDSLEYSGVASLGGRGVFFMDSRSSQAGLLPLLTELGFAIGLETFLSFFFLFRGKGARTIRTLA
jgi:hypothetical protein